MDRQGFYKPDVLSGNTEYQRAWYDILVRLDLGSSQKKSSYDYDRNCSVFKSGPTWETSLLLYPKNQFFIIASFCNSNIRSYGTLHRFSSLCSA